MLFPSSARNERRLAAVVAALLATAIVGCGQNHRASETRPAEQRRPGGTFTMAQDAPDGLDPARVDDVYEATIVNQIFDGLLTFDTHLNTIPCIASSWIISPDGTQYTFELKPGIRFHDGTRVTAEDVVYSLQRAFDFHGNEASLSREYLCHILGSEDYAAGRARSIRGLELLSPSVVRITLSQPYASFLAVLASELARIVPEHYVESVGASEFAKRPVGCGPFRFDRWEADRVVLTRFPQYAQSAVLLDSLVFEFPSGNARDYAASRFLENRMSAALVPDGRLGEFHRHPGTELLVRQELSLSFIGLNSRVKPFDDVRVRQAFAHAIDQQALVRADPNTRILPNGVLPPGMPGYTPETQLLQHDPEKARALLAEAGYPNGRGLPPIVHTSANTSEQARKQFEEIRRQVGEVGFDLRSQHLAWQDFSHSLRAQRLQCFTVTWVADIPDPDSFLFPLADSDGSANFQSYSQRQVDGLLLQGRATRSSLERLDVYRRAERLVLEDAPIVPLYHPLSVIAVQADVRGLNVTPMGVGNLQMEKVWLARNPGAAAPTFTALEPAPPPARAAAVGVAGDVRAGVLQGRMP